MGMIGQSLLFDIGDGEEPEFAGPQKSSGGGNQHIDVSPEDGSHAGGRPGVRNVDGLNPCHLAEGFHQDMSVGECPGRGILHPHFHHFLLFS